MRRWRWWRKRWEAVVIGLGRTHYDGMDSGKFEEDGLNCCGEGGRFGCLFVMRV